MSCDKSKEKPKKQKRLVVTRRTDSKEALLLDHGYEMPREENSHATLNRIMQ